MITILGPTACGKTALAAYTASRLSGEVISADSRQVYRGMDLGTGKDLLDFTVEGKQIPYHLVDILDPMEEYNVFMFQQGFFKAYHEIKNRGKLPVLCGGTGLYLESVLEGYNLVKVPIDEPRRQELANWTMEALVAHLASFGPLHATTDISSRDRLLKAIEQKEYFQRLALKPLGNTKVESLTFGIAPYRAIIRERITARLNQRLNEGLTDEVRGLLKQGISAERLMAFGLEYKWLTLFCTGAIDEKEMFTKLNTAIHQFAKRQMTWFRRMEKKEIAIHWFVKGETKDVMFNEIEKRLNKL
ncbi:MAG: tRNA (adenosine(37)-N6)-dimethylallyltransferase MiaA [Bacteroidota bacterium]